MFFRSLALAACMAMMAGSALAETHEILMLNRGDAGAMVFQPAFVKAAPGDTIMFVSQDKGHNAESIDGMLPDGVEAFKSKISADYELTVSEEGIYGVKCTPHYGLGMVALIQVGEAVNLETAQAAKHKGKAKKVFGELFALVE